MDPTRLPRTGRRKLALHSLLLATIGWALALPTLADALVQPEGASGFSTKEGTLNATFAVAAANPLAARAGQQILQAGGSAIDAAVAVQMVLTLVEPQSSGIGGGTFIVHAAGSDIQAYDGRETAPAAATASLFLQSDGKPMGFRDAVVGGRSVGVPGTLRVLHLAHRAHGRLPWKDLFAPAIRLATEGFAISPRMAKLLASETALATDPVARSFYYDAEGRPLPAGHLLRNPELAAVLKAIAVEGPDALMQGEVAQAIVTKVQSHANPGGMTLNDLAGYQAVVRKPVCFSHPAQGRPHQICGMPPPSSGTLAIGQILGVLRSTGADKLPLENGLPSAQWLHLYLEASRLAFADRAKYLADPAFVAPPAGAWDSLLNPSYLQERARAIDPQADAPRMPDAPAGNPVALTGALDSNASAASAGARIYPRYAPMADQPEYGTSHISIFDAYGNAIAMTSTIEDAWGSRLMVNRGKGLAGGFLLNNELTDFSFAPNGADGAPVANRVEPGKRPRSSMSPVLVTDDAGRVLMSAGSPGGAMIIHFTAKTLYGVLNWNLSPQSAIDLPNFGTLGGPVFTERGLLPAATLESLRSRGHTVNEAEMTSGLQAIQRTRAGYIGGADPRREGTVLGD